MQSHRNFFSMHTRYGTGNRKFTHIGVVFGNNNPTFVARKTICEKNIERDEEWILKKKKKKKGKQWIITYIANAKTFFVVRLEED